jgi:hypothetical protein
MGVFKYCIYIMMNSAFSSMYLGGSVACKFHSVVSGKMYWTRYSNETLLCTAILTLRLVNNWNNSKLVAQFIVYLVSDEYKYDKLSGWLFQV